MWCAIARTRQAHGTQGELVYWYTLEARIAISGPTKAAFTNDRIM